MAVLTNNEYRSRELVALAEVAKALSVHQELPEILEAVMAKIDEVLDPLEFGVVMLWDHGENIFRPHASCGRGIVNRKSLYAMEINENESITGIVFAEDKARYWDSPQEVANAQANMEMSNSAKMMKALGGVELKSVVAAPLIVNQQKFGVLILGTLVGDKYFSKNDVDFVQTLADLIALAIDRSRMENKIVATHAEKQADRLRAEALATLSHELRTPLAAIKGYSTALLLEEVDWSEKKRVEFLKLIDEECDNLQAMISDILDSALIDVGQLLLEIQPCRLERITHEVAEEMQRRTESHKLVIDFQQEFPIVDIDIRRIKQVLRNIIDNSIKYSPDGGLIVIRGEVRKGDIVMSISDQGVGISPEDLIPLFEKYFRVKAPTGFYVPGTGLGLPVARTLVEAHGGRIWAESKVSEGTTLLFSIPFEP